MRRLCLIFVMTLSIADTAASQPPTGRLPAAVTPTAYRIDLTVLPDQPRFRGHVEIDVNAESDEKSLFLHGQKLHVSKASVKQAGKTLAATYREVDASGVVQLDLPRALEHGPATLVFDYDAAFASGSAGLYRLKVGQHWYAWTQLEAIDARAVFPCFDQPEWKTPFAISVLTAPDQLAVSNAAESGSKLQGKLLRHDYEPTPPLPTYLVALAVGPFDVVESTIPATSHRAKPLPLRVLATRGNKDSLAYALAETKPIVSLLEGYFGRAFPFSKLDQIASPVMGGAMENAGAVIYDDSILVLGPDAPVRTRQGFGMVVAHELAHQWFGDLVTPVWWEDIWLNESFATWLGYRIANQWKPELNIGNGALFEGFRAMELDSLHEGRPVQQPIRVSGEIETAFDRITYGKGGKVIEMVEAYLGAEKLQKGVRLHMDRFAGRNAASRDFFQSLADAANEPRIVTAMQGFVEQQGVPVVKVERSGAQLKLTQARYAPLGAAAPPATSWVIPFCVRAGAAKQCVLFDKSSSVIALPGKDPRAPLMPNAGGHGYYRFSLADADWRALIANGTQLSASEALAVIDSLWAEWKAGAAPLALLLDAARAFAAHSDSYVAIDVGDRLSDLRARSMLSPAELPAYRRLMSDLFAARLHKLGFDPKAGAYNAEEPDTSRLRGQLVHYMFAEADNAEVSNTLAAAATSWIDGDQSALDRTFLSDGLAVWLRRNGAAGITKLWTKLIATTDADLRHRMARAISSADDPAVARHVFANLGRPGLRSDDKLILIMTITREPATRELGFDWLAHNLPKLAKEANLSSVGALFEGPTTFCSEADSQRIERSLRPHVDALKRGALALDRVVENVHNCGALKSAQQADLAAAFGARAKLDATLK